MKEVWDLVFGGGIYLRNECFHYDAVGGYFLWAVYFMAKLIELDFF